MKISIKEKTWLFESLTFSKAKDFGKECEKKDVL